MQGDMTNISNSTSEEILNISNSICTVPVNCILDQICQVFARDSYGCFIEQCLDGTWKRAVVLQKEKKHMTIKEATIIWQRAEIGLNILFKNARRLGRDFVASLLGRHCFKSVNKYIKYFEKHCQIQILKRVLL